MPGGRAAWLKFGAPEEIADLFERSSVLEGKAHQTGNDVAQTGHFRGAVGTLEPKEDLCRPFVVMDAHAGRAFAGDPDLLANVGATGRGIESVVHAATTNSSILKLSGRSGVAPLCAGSRWGHHTR